MTTPVSAMVLEISPNQYNTLSVKFENAEVQTTIDRLEKEWGRMFPEKTFQFTFLDEQLESQYQSFQNFGIIIRTFACIAILISCLGVYGLVLFTVQRKVKEIGVRKVLGAGIGSILRLIYQDFAWLLAIGFIVAIPMSYYFMNQWLQNFTYRTSIDMMTYLISFSLVVLVVGLTIAYQALQAAMANPVKSLRSE
jgi:putative ABC transport system permease protein